MSPDHWLRKFEDDAELLAVVEAYKGLSDNPAWLHLSSRLFRLKDVFEKAILSGERAPDGRDLTPEMRSAYGLLLQILSLPAEAIERQLRHEEEVMNYPGPVSNREPEAPVPY